MMQQQQVVDMRVAGGVASAIEGCIQEYYPDTDDSY